LQIGVRESTGHNDGDQVEKYLRSAGMEKGNPWCAAFVNYCLQQCNIETVSAPAWSPSWFADARCYYKRGSKGVFECQTADVFGIYFSNKGRVAHVGFIDDQDGDYVITVEGNTNEAGSREGDGVYRKRRPKRTIYALSRYL